MAKKRLAFFSTFAVAVLAGTGGALLAAECVDPNVPAPCPRVGPQSPRDILMTGGTNPVKFSKAPPTGELRLCDIHFHKYAEHKIPGTVAAAPPGGFACTSMSQTATRDATKEGAEQSVCESVNLWDTVEVHWVFTSCNVDPAPCLGSCFSKSCLNPNLRVAAQVFFLTPDNYARAVDWAAAGYNTNPPAPAPTNVEYLGSTTGPDFNGPNACSPYQATWSVARGCGPLTLSSLGRWCANNPFNENKPHGVRTLVTDPTLLAPIR